MAIWLPRKSICHWTPRRYLKYTYAPTQFLLLIIFMINLCLDHPRYVEANAGCKHFDVHGGPENRPVSRFSFDAKVYEL